MHFALFAFLYYVCEKLQVLFSSCFLSPCPDIYIGSASTANVPVFPGSIYKYIFMKMSFRGTKQWHNEQPAFLCALPHIYHLWNCYIVPAVAAIGHRDCERDVTEKACCRSIYTFCNGQVCLNPETARQARLNCYPIFHNACNRSCATWLIAHLMLPFAACSGHSSIAFGEEILLSTRDHFVLCIWNEQQWVQSFCMEKAVFKILMLLTLKPRSSRALIPVSDTTHCL